MTKIKIATLAHITSTLLMANLVALLVLLPAYAFAQVEPLEPLPTKPLGPITSQNPTTPPAPPPPVTNVDDAKRLFDALKGVKDIKTGEQGADAAAALADQLRDINIPGAISGLDKLIPEGTASDLTKIGDLLGALQNGNYWGGINDAYNELAKRYALPNLPQDQKNKIYGQLKKLHELLSGKASINDMLKKWGNDLLNKLKTAGLSAAGKALDDLINGRLKGKSAEDVFKGSDLGKLKDAYAQDIKCTQNSMQDVMSKVVGRGQRTAAPSVKICE